MITPFTFFHPVFTTWALFVSGSFGKIDELFFLGGQVIKLPILLAAYTGMGLCSTYKTILFGATWATVLNQIFFGLENP